MTEHEARQQQPLLEQLIVSISRLARPPEGQIAYLDALGPDTPVDELALELDDVAPALAVAQLLSSRQRALLAALDEQLAAMSGQAHAELWSRDALRTAPAWAAVRKLAGDALAAFHAGALARR